jgi:RNA polymerase sigma-70 factor (ECF subfamily)
MPAPIRPLRLAGDGQRVALPVLMGRNTPDAELVRRALGGDHWAEEMLYRKHVDFVLGQCTRLLRHAADAEDAAQEAFVVALGRLDKLRDPELFRGWVSAIAVRRTYPRMRRRRILRWLGIDRSAPERVMESYASDALSPEMRTELARLERLLSELPEVERVAWQLRHVEGYELEEVAELGSCSLSTAKRRIARAESKLATRIRLEEAEA